MTLTRPANGTLAIIWRYIAITLFSVTMLIAGFIMKETNARITALEQLQIERAACLAEINTKLDILLTAHDIKLTPRQIQR